MDDDEAARKLFVSAIETAHAQGSRAWGLRAATSLARREPAWAHDLLAAWLEDQAEGAWTPDVMAARSLLRAPQRLNDRSVGRR